MTLYTVALRTVACHAQPRPKYRHANIQAEWANLFSFYTGSAKVVQYKQQLLLPARHAENSIHSNTRPLQPHQAVLSEHVSLHKIWRHQCICRLRSLGDIGKKSLVQNCAAFLELVFLHSSETLDLMSQYCYGKTGGQTTVTHHAYLCSILKEGD